jgi:thioredoxin reductase (NADPH)
VERNAPGGQAGHSPRIENFLGFPSGISGSELARRAVAQARRFGAEILTTVSVTGLRMEGNTKTVSLSDGSEVTAQIVLIATGAWFHRLESPAVEQWDGAGIYYGAAQTEAMHYRDREVVVIGAANSAAQAVLYLAKYAKRIRVLIRGEEPTWSRYLDVAIRENPDVELLFNTEFREFCGANGQLESISTHNKLTGESATIPAAAVFVFIGQRPQSDFLGDSVQRTERGHVLTGYDVVRTGNEPNRWPLNRDPMVLETSMPGVFAAGDIRSGSRNGISAAVGDGNAVASMFWQYLGTL